MTNIYTLTHTITNTKYGIHKKEHYMCTKSNKINIIERRTHHVVVFKKHKDAKRIAESLSTFIQENGKHPNDDELFSLPYEKRICLDVESDIMVERENIKDVLYKCKKNHLGFYYVSNVQTDMLEEKEIIDAYLYPPEENDIVYITKTLNEMLTNS